MSIPAAYLTVILIWSTTPLGIQWSSVGVGYEFGLAARMLIGMIALLTIVRLRRLPLPWDKHARYVYLACGLPMFMAMSFAHWSAQYIPSGWISVIFGLSPLFTSVFAFFILSEKTFTGGRLTGMLLGLAGLVVVFSESINLSSLALMGVIGMTASALSQSLGAVLIKRLKPRIHPISITVGGLIVAMPLFALNCFMGPGLPNEIPVTTLMSIVYLAAMGTMLGFPLYFYLLKNINAERVALIALITPVTALLLGATLNNEIITLKVWIGTALILTGLGIYEYGKYLPFKKKWQIRWNQRPL
jgi:drug/metabolite transporter (DMT)-like permease